MAKHRRPSRGVRTAPRARHRATSRHYLKIQKKPAAAALACGTAIAVAMSTLTASTTERATASIAADAGAAQQARVTDGVTGASRSQDRSVDSAETRPISVAEASKSQIRSGKPTRPAAKPGRPPATASTLARRQSAPPAVKTLPSVPGLTAEQVQNAAVIVSVGRSMHVSVRGQIIAVATALQESRLYNLRVAVDHDSLGLFQQRPSAGWGTRAQLTDPAYATRKFYQQLVTRTGDWGCLTCAAQRVQRSAFPNAYAKHEPLATRTVAALSNYP